MEHHTPLYQTAGKVLKLLETNHLTTTSYHPQTNGLCERLNHTLADMLSMYISSDHRNWDEILVLDTNPIEDTNLMWSDLHFALNFATVIPGFWE